MLYSYTLLPIIIDGREQGALRYNIGDRVSHPLHGAGVIAGVESQKIDGEKREYYILKLLNGDMKVKIPLGSADKVGVRPIICADEAECILRAIADVQVISTSSWNKRYRENMEKLRTGDLLEVASVIKGLLLRDREKGLSTGERKMLSSAKQILFSELVLSLDCSYEEAEEQLEQAMA